VRYWDSEEKEAQASEKKASALVERVKVLMMALGLLYTFNRIKSWLGKG